jgi:hypothetical protein
MLQCSAHIDKMFSKQSWHSAGEQSGINCTSNCGIKRNLGKYRCANNRLNIVHTKRTPRLGNDDDTVRRGGEQRRAA